MSYDIYKIIINIPFIIPLELLYVDYEFDTTAYNVKFYRLKIFVNYEEMSTLYIGRAR